MIRKSTHKLLSTLLAALLLLLILSVGYIGFAADETGGCGSGLTWTYNDASKTLTISGNGAMNDYGAGYTPWAAHAYELTKVVFEGNVTKIGTCAFYHCSALSEITLPNSVESIGDFAFDSCVSLQTIVIPDQVKSIGQQAFYYCTGLVSVKLGQALESVLYGAFSCCSALVRITIPDTTVSIGGGAFAGCALKYVHIGDGVKRIGESAFASCPVTDLYIGKSVVSIGNNAFQNCSLEELTLGESVQTVGSYAFAYCNLSKVTMYNKVAVIGEGAFSNQNNQENYIIAHGYYYGTEAEFDEIAFGQYNQALTDAEWNFEEHHSHNYTEVVTKAATCTEAGVKTFTCTCGDSYTEPVAALGHIDANDDGVCDRCRTQMRANEPDDQKEEQSFFEKLLEMIRDFFYKLFHLFG